MAVNIPSSADADCVQHLAPVVHTVGHEATPMGQFDWEGGRGGDVDTRADQSDRCWEDRRRRAATAVCLRRLATAAAVDLARRHCLRLHTA